MSMNWAKSSIGAAYLLSLNVSAVKRLNQPLLLVQSERFLNIPLSSHDCSTSWSKVKMCYLHPHVPLMSDLYTNGCVVFVL